MAEAAVSFAVQKLGDLAIEKVTFLGGVAEQVKRLKSELQRMQCFLKDAAEKQFNDNRILQWISEIKELAQDTEDVIETFVLKVENPKENDNLLKKYVTFPKHVYHLEKVGKEIESIRARLKDIDESRERFGIQNLGDATSSSMISNNVGMRRQMSPWQKDKHVVGFGEDVEILLKRVVLEERDGLSVTTIVGMGGLGKSTLAKAVYNHAAVAAGFDSRAWVCVSNDFKPKEIIKELVLQLVEPGETSQVLEIMEKAPLEHIKSMLYQRLQGTRYFIVLDDVWHEQAWESLATAFPDQQDKASRLLLTSRNQDVPRCARYVHKLKTLEWVKSWQLFLKKAFVDGKCPEDLEETGKEILRKCYGLPLAITVVGGLLLRESRSGWEKVLKGMNSYMGSSETSSVSAILELSYHDLPPQLKSCFLCLGLFKEDATIRASKLVQVWIAEGFVRQEGGGEETMEEIARSYLDELINRNMVQVKDTSLDDRVKICHIHDLLRDLSIRKAKEEIGFEIIREGESETPHKSRHRAIYSRRHASFTYSESSSSNSHIRSLFFHEGGAVDSHPSYWKSFELLRVLDMKDCGLIVLPDTICKLTGLRYLGLRRNHLEMLPSSLDHLKNLQVLDVRENYILKVPNVVWKMDSLRHLYMFRGKMPLKIGVLKNLQTLAFILIDSQTLKHLTQMTSLRKLRIYVESNTDVSKLCNSLSTMENLFSLYLGFHVNNGTESSASLEIYNGQSFESLHRLHHLTLAGCMTKLPRTAHFPPNLSYLTLSGNNLDEDPMAVLEKLPKLLYLKLHSAYDGEEMVISQDGFPRLEVLSLVHLKKLSNVEFGEGALQKIERLEIYRCKSLWKIISPDRLPKELRSKIVTSHQHLHLQLSDHTEYINV